MRELNTQQVVRLFATTCVDWLNEGSRLEDFNYNNYNKLWLSLGQFRRYLDKFLDDMVADKVGTDWEVDLGHYKLTSSEDKHYVVVKRSDRKLPKLPSSYIGWVDWDLREIGLVSDIHGRYVSTMYHGNYSWSANCGNVRGRLSLLHASLLSQVLVQALFNLLGKVDLASKPLPSEDVRCRIGSYEMLYDHLMQEWRIWKKK